MIKSQS